LIADAVVLPLDSRLRGNERRVGRRIACFAPNPANPNHVHFIDGADGGYATAASAMKGA